jgi:hypothetical protein
MICPVSSPKNLQEETLCIVQQVRILPGQG